MEYFSVTFSFFFLVRQTDEQYTEKSCRELLKDFGTYIRTDLRSIMKQPLLLCCVEISGPNELHTQKSINTVRVVHTTKFLIS